MPGNHWRTAPWSFSTPQTPKKNWRNALRKCPEAKSCVARSWQSHQVDLDSHSHLLNTLICPSCSVPWPLDTQWHKTAQPHGTATHVNNTARYNAATGPVLQSVTAQRMNPTMHPPSLSDSSHLPANHTTFLCPSSFLHPRWNTVAQLHKPSCFQLNPSNPHLQSLSNSYPSHVFTQDPAPSHLRHLASRRPGVPASRRPGVPAHPQLAMVSEA